MPATLRSILVSGAMVLAAALMPTAAVAQNYEQTFTVINDSHYRINHVYVSPVYKGVWGNDKLGSRYLFPNYRFDLAVSPGWYDVKLIDQYGNACQINAVDFRDGNTWTITDALLLTCEALSGN
jgi:hypothetical protein